MLDILEMRSGYHREAFATELLTETQLSAEVALGWGLIHEIENRQPRCDVHWPAVVAASDGQLPVPPQYLTSNYLRACRAAPPRMI
jgi:hypothetical protein